MTGAAQIRCFADPVGAARALAAQLVLEGRACQTERGRFTLALTGGATARQLYAALTAAECREFPWEATELFWSDERAVPPGHPDSNQRLARETLLAHGRTSESQIHPMIRTPGDAVNPDGAAAAYEQVLRELTGADSPVLDVVLLGLGPDGHMASLFPGADSLQEMHRSVIVVRNSPKPPPVRVTMTVPIISGSAVVHLLVVGAEKADAVRETLEGARDSVRWPAQALASAAGSVTWWLDAAAAGGLRRESGRSRVGSHRSNL